MSPDEEILDQWILNQDGTVVHTMHFIAEYSVYSASNQIKSNQSGGGRVVPIPVPMTSRILCLFRRATISLQPVLAGPPALLLLLISPGCS